MIIFPYHVSINNLKSEKSGTLKKFKMDDIEFLLKML